MQAYLAACLIFRDEARYLAEWLCFHRLVGIERFFLYNNRSSDDYRAAIAQSGRTDDVELIDWPQHPGQIAAYDDCLRRFADAARWIAFIDIDEFLFSPVAERVSDLLPEYERYPALGVNWLLFGTSGHAAPPPGLVTLSFTRRGTTSLVAGFPQMLKAPDLDPRDLRNYWPQSAHVKCIVDPRRTERCVNPHRFAYAPGPAPVIETHRALRGQWSDEVSVERFRINHYWTRSRAELELKLGRQRADSGTTYQRGFADGLERMLDAVEDRSIVPLARRVAAALGAAP